MSSDNINACVSKQIEINDNMSVPYWIKYPNAQCSKQYAKPSALDILNITRQQAQNANKKGDAKMQNNTPFPEDMPTGDAKIKSFNELKNSMINMLSENKYTISETRYLFTCILSQFERDMPVTNHV